MLSRTFREKIKFTNLFSKPFHFLTCTFSEKVFSFHFISASIGNKSWCTHHILGASWTRGQFCKVWHHWNRRDDHKPFYRREDHFHRESWKRGSRSAVTPRMKWKTFSLRRSQLASCQSSESSPTTSKLVWVSYSRIDRPLMSVVHVNVPLHCYKGRRTDSRHICKALLSELDLRS